MEYWLYIFSSSAALSYIFFKKRKFDLFTILIICSFYYSSPLLIGILYDPDKHNIINISSEIYWFYSLFFGVSIMGAHIFDKLNKKQVYIKKYNYSAIQFHFLITSFIFLVILAIDSSFFFQKEVGEKSANQFGPLWGVYTASNLILLSLSMNSRIRHYIGIAIFFLLTTLIAGSRAYFAAGLAVIALGTFKNSTPMRIGMKFSLVLKILIGFTFIFSWKIAYPFILAGQYGEAFQTISDPVAIGFRLFKGSEAGLCMLSFHHAIDYFETSPGSFFELIVVKLIPFLSLEFATAFNLNGLTFSDILNGIFYKTVNYGMASNLWGSIYYVIGKLGLILFVMFFSWLIIILNKLIIKNNLWSHHLVGPSAFLCFYGTRLEVGSLAYLFYVNIALLILYGVMKSILIIKPKNKSIEFIFYSKNSIPNY